MNALKSKRSPTSPNAKRTSSLCIRFATASRSICSSAVRAFASFRHFGIERMHAIGRDVGTTALLFAAVRKPELFESLVVGSGATSPDLAASHLTDLINSPAGAFAETEGGDIGAGFVAQSAIRETPSAVLEDYRLSSAGRRFADAANFVR